MKAKRDKMWIYRMWGIADADGDLLASVGSRHSLVFDTRQQARVEKQKGERIVPVFVTNRKPKR